MPVSAPGWYPDPQDPRQARWWDGATWTAHVAAPGGVGPAPAGPQGPPASAAPAKDRTGLIVGLGVAAGLVVVVLVVGLTMLGRTAREALPPAPDRSTTAGGRPDDPSGASLADRADQADVPLLDEEGVATHTHTLVRVSVDGRDVVIPAAVGIDGRSGRIAALHTHEDRGVLHVESPERDDTYTLGQFLTLWGAGADEDAVCGHLTGGPCSLEVTVVTPTAADRREFTSFGPMPDEPPVVADGLDTLLAQGLVIEVAITSGAR